MAIPKQYTLFMHYLKEKCYPAQMMHVMEEMYESRDENRMSEEAKALWKKWRTESNFAITLNGGWHAAMEDMYAMLQKIPEIPSAKFNESQEAMGGVCTIVMFVATEDMVALGDFARKNGISAQDFKKTIMEMIKKSPEDAIVRMRLKAVPSEEMVNVMEKITYMALS